MASPTEQKIWEELEIPISDLNRYFNGDVTISTDSAERSREIAEPIIEKILEFINRNDPRFSSKPQLVGSSRQRLKVGQADEFDINVHLCEVDELFWCKDSKKRYYGFSKDVGEVKTMREDISIVPTSTPLPEPPTGCYFIDIENPEHYLWQNADDVFYDGSLVPFLVKKRFHALLVEAIRSLDLRGKVFKSRKMHGPAVTIRIEENGHHPISVDFAIVIPSSSKFPRWVRWPRNKKWPPEEKVEKIKEIGINDVARGDFCWQLSFAAAENELLDKIDQDSGCRKKCLRIMKKLRTDVWCPSNGRPVITSYHLKNILFWECQQYPHSEDWEHDMLSTRFTSMLRKLRKCLQDRTLSQYFYAEKNLLDDKDNTEIDHAIRRMDRFVAEPQRYLVPASEE